MGLSITLKDFELVQIGESLCFLERLNGTQYRLVVHNTKGVKEPVKRECHMVPELIKEMEPYFTCEKSMWARKQIKEKYQKG